MTKGRLKNVILKTLNTDLFLRSINLCFDADHPERIAHFRPTQKSIPIMRAFLTGQGERSFLIVAPYGSGKSILFTYLLNAIENRQASENVLNLIEDRIISIDTEFGEILKLRRRNTRQGLVLALHGFQSNLPEAIYNAAKNAISRNKLGRQFRSLKAGKVSTIDEVVEFLNEFRAICGRCNIDRVAILWDESGRHLETLISDGRATELSDIQVIAEYASRSSNVPVFFSLSLHQSMLHYAQRMPQSVRAEWLKISGRFETVQYIDDSKEIYRLVADIIEAQANSKNATTINFASYANDAIVRHGLFGDFTQRELVEIAAKIYPTHLSVLYILPRLASRIAQHERTLFTFLNTIQNTSQISVPTLYDYFSSSMRSDTSVGGTYKQWLETESAISKTKGNKTQVEVLKTACLLGLGTKGERNRLSKTTLEWTLQSYEDPKSWKRSVNTLIKNKLLLYREHSEDISIWHGTDLDLRGRLIDLIRRNRETFDLVEFLEKEAQPEAWKPVEYNTRIGTNRYWLGEYRLASKGDLSTILQPIRIGDDGKILYFITESQEDIQSIQKVLVKQIDDPQIISVISATPLDLRAASLEVWSLSQMQHDPDLTGEDPLVLPELKQMLDDARMYLQSILDRLLQPSADDGPLWYYRGKILPIVSASSLRKELTKINSTVFPDTPRIFNELVNRHKISGTIVNSRKKLIMGILERHGSSDLGLKATAPEASMFRTILLHSGIYRKTETGSWDYTVSLNPEIEFDQGLWKAWMCIRDFFVNTQEDGKAKKPSKLINELLSPPYGIRSGLIPILFAAGLKAFAHAISLRRRGEYVTDILPSVIEEIIKSPDDYELSVLDMNEASSAYLDCMRAVFAGQQQLVYETDVVRAAFDAIQSWLFQLPRATWNTASLSKDANTFLSLIRRIQSTDPLVLMLQTLPHDLNYDYADLNQVKEVITPLKVEVEGISHTYAKKACESLFQALSPPLNGNELHIQRLAQDWAEHFPESVINAGMPSIARSFLTRIRMEYKDTASFLNSIALLMVGKGVEDWDDTTSINFESRVQELAHRIEEIAIKYVTSDRIHNIDAAFDGMSSFLISRIENQISQLYQLIGEERAKRMISSMLESDTNGNDE